MSLLEAAAQQAAEAPAALVDWLPLAVAFVGATSAVGVAIWNGRGETAALRKLKAMNEALEGLPEQGAVASGFGAARDLLAERIATRITGPSPWKRVGRWIIGVVAGVAVVWVAWSLLLLAPQLSAFSESLISLLAALAGSAVAVAITTSSWISLRRSARQAEEVRRAAVERAFEIRRRAEVADTGQPPVPGQD